MSNSKPATKCVHSGTLIDPSFGGVVTPTYTASAHLFHENGKILYPRYMSTPTQQAVARKLSDLEEGQDCLLLASGMAAVATTVMTYLGSGDNILIYKDVYGGTSALGNSILPRMDISTITIGSEKTEDFAAAITPKTKMMIVESPGNPLLSIIDLQALANLAKQKNILLVVDNTFATPINQRPLELGADIVVHSGTKYLNGHNDLTCGAIIADKEKIEAIHETLIHLGGCLNAQDCSLLERGLKTLELRIGRHNSNGLQLAQFLDAHPKVQKVYYPGLSSHPGHETAKSQMSGFGGMLTVELKCNAAQARQMVDNLNIFHHAISLGGLESLVCFPALTSHAEISAQERKAAGISDSLLRLSVGIEDIQDLIEDFSQALATIS